MAVHELFAYICCRNAAAAIDFYARAFGAREKFRLTEPGGRIGHAEVDFGGTTLMLADEHPEYGIRAPEPAHGTPVTIHIHVDNADDVIRQAVQAGATVEIEPQDHFYGERGGCIRDPFGHRWSIGHHIEDVTSDEMQRRYNESFQGERVKVEG
jgi:PhnB protein